VFPVLISIRQRIALYFNALHESLVRWMKPHSTSLLLGTIADLARGKSALLVENALLRQQVIILRRQVKDGCETAETLSRDDRIDQRDGQKQSALGSPEYPSASEASCSS